MANRILLLNEDCQTLILEAVLLCGEQGIATIEPTSYWSSKLRVVTTSPENTFTKAFPELSSKVIEAAVNATRVFELHFPNDVDATLASWASAVPLQNIRYLRLMVGHEMIVDSMPAVKTICPANHRPRFQLAKLLESLPGLVDLELQLNVTYADIGNWSQRAIEIQHKDIRDIFFYRFVGSFKAAPNLFSIRIQHGNANHWGEEATSHLNKFSMRKTKTAHGWQMDMKELSVSHAPPPTLQNAKTTPQNSKMAMRKLEKELLRSEHTGSTSRAFVQNVRQLRRHFREFRGKHTKFE